MPTPTRPRRRKWTARRRDRCCRADSSPPWGGARVAWWAFAHPTGGGTGWVVCFAHPAGSVPAWGAGAVRASGRGWRTDGFPLARRRLPAQPDGGGIVRGSETGKGPAGAEFGRAACDARRRGVPARPGGAGVAGRGEVKAKVALARWAFAHPTGSAPHEARGVRPRSRGSAGGRRGSPRGGRRGP